MERGADLKTAVEEPDPATCREAEHDRHSPSSWPSRACLHVLRGASQSLGLHDESALLALGGLLSTMPALHEFFDHTGTLSIF
jgi:hypothetical protein